MDKNITKKKKKPTINLPPQFARSQQGLLYALQITRRKSEQQAGAKQHPTKKTETRFFKPRFNVADHFYVLLCTRRGEVYSISAVVRSLSSLENNAPKNMLEQQMSQLVSAYTTARNDLKHKIEATKTDNKKLGTCGFPRTLNSAEILTNLQVLHPRHTDLKTGQTKAKPLRGIRIHKIR